MKWQHAGFVTAGIACFVVGVVGLTSGHSSGLSALMAVNGLIIIFCGLAMKQ